MTAAQASASSHQPFGLSMQDSFSQPDFRSRAGEKSDHDWSIDHVSHWQRVRQDPATDPATKAGDGSRTSAEDQLAVHKCFAYLEKVWPTNQTTPETAGPFTLECQIGRGGMGTVWLAQQHDPIKRTVAVKLIKPGPASKRMVQRFESERKVLALMNHPGIASIIDAGSTDDGQLYFAMELVDGPNLIEFCHENRLSIRERLELLLEACNAIQHAHQKGIIHRDLKPTNILVGKVDGNPHVKVIDFGLSKFEAMETNPDRIISNDIPRKESGTLDGQVIGSVHYMSPEQAAGQTAAIDTRSDIYSLGIILYKLLTDSIPLDKESMRDAPLEKLLAAIQQDDETPPSVLLSKKPADEFEKISLHRRAKPATYRRVLETDLDWIAMRAICKDPEKRYASVSELTADIQRFLNSEPIAARPSSTMYLAKKRFAKNRTLWSAVAGAAIALVVGIVLSTAGFVSANNSQKLAQSRLKQSVQSNDILAEVFTDIDYDLIEARKEPFRLFVAKKLSLAAERLKGNSIGDSQETIKLQVKLANALNSLEFFEEAIPIAEDAFNIAARRQPGTEFEAGKTLVVALLGAAKMAKANEVLQSLFTSYGSLEEADNEIFTDLELLRGRVEYSNFRPHEAQIIFESVAQNREALYGENDLRTAGAKYWQSMCFLSTERVDEGARVFKDVAESHKKLLPTGHPKTIYALLNYAWALSLTGDPAESNDICDEIFTQAIDLYGENHPIVQEIRLTQGLVAFQNGDRRRGFSLLDQSLQGLSSSSGSDHPRAISARLVLARIYRRQGNPERSIELFEECLKLSGVERGIETELAETYLETGDYSKIHTLLDNPEFDTSESRLKKIEQHQRNFLIGSAFGEQRQYENAIRFLENAHAGLSNSPDTYGFPGMRVTLALARNQSKNGDHDQALETLQDYLENMPERFGPKNRIRLCCLAEKGLALRQAGKIDDAIETMEGVVETGVRLRYQGLLIQELRLAWNAAGNSEAIKRSIDSQNRSIRRRYADSPLEMAKAFRSLGRELIDLDQFERSTALLGEAETIFKESEDDWNLATVQFDLARIKLISANEGSTEIEDAVRDLDTAWVSLQGSLDEVYPKARIEISDFIREINAKLEGSSLDREKTLWQERLAMLQLFDA